MFQRASIRGPTTGLAPVNSTPVDTLPHATGPRTIPTECRMFDLLPLIDQIVLALTYWLAVLQHYL